jgi:hypothetical protein
MKRPVAKLWPHPARYASFAGKATTAELSILNGPPLVVRFMSRTNDARVTARPERAARYTRLKATEV